MAFQHVYNLKDQVAGILSGLDINNVPDLYGAFERGARTLMQHADVPEATLTQNLTLYSGVFDYPCDERIFGTAINDIAPQGVSRVITDFVYKQDAQTFDRTKLYNYNGTQATFTYINGSPIIRIVSKLPQEKIIIDPMTSTTGWMAGGSASNLAQDNTVYYAAPASLRFTLTGSSTGTLTKTLANPVDLSAYEGIGVSFLAIRIPPTATAADLTSISVKLGSDNANYASQSNTEGFLGTWISGEWLLVAFDFATAITTGSPDWSNIQYVQVSFAHTSTMTNFNVGGLWIALPTPVNVVSQTAAIFKTSTGQPTQNITNDDDEILLLDPAYNMYLYESALAVLENTGAGEGDATRAMILNKLYGNVKPEGGLYTFFRGDNPSQELRQTGSWYDTGGQGNSYNNSYF